MPDRQDPPVPSGASIGRVRQSFARFPGERALRRLLVAVIGIAVVLYFGVAATVLGLRYAVLPRLDNLRPRIEQTLSDRLHATVRIGNLAAHWSGLQPTLEIRQLTIRDRAGAVALTVPSATAIVSWRSLPRWQLLLSSLVIEHADVLVARDAHGAVTVGGIALGVRDAGKNTFATWLLSQRAVVLHQATLHWRDALAPGNATPDAGAPALSFTGIKLAILNNGHRHRIGLQAQPDGQLLHGPLDLRANFRHGVLSVAGAPANWSGEAYVAPGALDLPTLARYVDLPIEARGGRVDAHLWLKFAHGRIGAAQGDLAGDQLLLRINPTLPVLDVPTLALHWSAAHARDNYTLNVANLRMELGGQPPLSDGTPLNRLLRIGRFSGHWREASHGHGQVIGIAGDTVDIGLLAEFARTLPLPRDTLRNLTRFEPRGILRNYTLEFERAAPRPGKPAAAASQASGPKANVSHAPDAPDAPLSHYRLQAQLEGVSLAAQAPAPGLNARGHPHIGLPGFENLSGQINADETQGSLALASQHAAVIVPGLFDDPRLVFDQLAGKASWKLSPGRAHAAVQVDLPELTVSNADAAAQVRATYSNPGQGRGSLDLQAHFDRAATARVVRYLPTSIGEHLRGYLGHAIQGGVTRNATIQVRGDLAEFPYEHNPKAGVFHIVAPFADARFDPSAFPPRRSAQGVLQDWPGFDGVDGTLELQQNVLQFNIDQAHYRKVALSKVSGRIPDLGNLASNLVITGQASGPLDDLLAYLNASPVAALADHASQQLSGKGNAALALRVEVPRHPQPHVGVAGTLALANNELVFGPLPPLTQLQGKVDFTEHSITMHGTTAQFLGGPVTGNGGLRADGSVDLSVAGRISADAVRGHYQDHAAASLMQQISGSAPYSLSVRAAAHQPPDIVASSDLSGLGIDLPAPLGKATGTPMPFKLTLAPVAAEPGDVPGVTQDAAPLQKIDAQLGPLAATYLRRGGAHPAVLRGAIGINRPAALPAQGVAANLELRQFDIDAWQAALRKFNAGPAAPAGGAAKGHGAAGAAAAYLPERIDAHVGALTLLNRQWQNVALEASRQNGAWQANLNSDQASGHIAWRPQGASGGAALQARLSKLAVPDSKGGDLVSQALENHDRDFPSIDLIIDDLSIHQRNLGRLEVAAHNTHDNGIPVWQLDKLLLGNPAAKLSATGNWRAAPKSGPISGAAAGAVSANDPRRTALDFKLDIADAGALLDRLGQPHALAGGSGTLAGQVGWRGGPASIDYPSLGGTLSLDLKNGQILQANPGIGKLLGVLSLQSLARFLTFDFKGVFGKGLAFDRVSATGTIRNGTASTDDFRIVSGPANITMKGSANIAKEQQNLLVTVAPKINASSAALAAAVVNPLLGLGGLVAQLVLSESLSKGFARDYAVTGSWAHPQIQRVATDRGNMIHPAEQSSPD